MKLRVGLVAAIVLAIPLLSSMLGETLRHKTVIDSNARDISQVDLLHDPAFIFRYGEGSGWGGFDTFEVDATGHCSYSFRAQRTNHLNWKRAKFDCDAQSLLYLRQLLINLRATELPKEFHD